MVEIELRQFGIFDGHWEHFMAIWYILWAFGVYPVHFFVAKPSRIFLHMSSGDETWQIYPYLVGCTGKIWQPS
jgi:hypothetical protein